MITTYQIRNVLRVHGDQLKRRNTQVRDSVDAGQQRPDFVNISIEAKRKQMLSEMSNHLISEIQSKKQKNGAEVASVSYNRTQIPVNGDN